MISLILVGALLVICGFIYLRWPNIYRRGIWLKTSITVRMMSPEGYVRYMRGLGLLFIVIGVGLIVLGLRD